MAIVSALLCLGPTKGRAEEHTPASGANSIPRGAVAGRATGTGPKSVTSADITRAWQAAAMASHMEDRRAGSVSGAAAGGSHARGGGALGGQGRGRERGEPWQGAGGGVPGLGVAKARARVLICAQSNAAVDEIISRLGKGAGFSNPQAHSQRDGAEGFSSSSREFSIVRVGNPKTIHPDSMPYHIDELVAKKLGSRAGQRADGENHNDEGQRGAGHEERGGQRDASGRNVNGKANLSELRAKLDRTFEVIRAIEAIQWKSSGGAKTPQGPEGLRGTHPREGNEPSEEGAAKKDKAGVEGGGKENTGAGSKGGSNPSSSDKSSKGAKEGKEGKEGEEEQSAEEVAAAVVAQGEAMVRAKLNMLHREKRELSRALADAKRDQREAAEEERAARAAAKREILRGAELVVTTLNGCGGDVYAACLGLKEGPGMDGSGAQGGGGEFGAGFGRKARRGGGGLKEDDEAGLFDAVIIDEAAQVRGSPVLLLALRACALTLVVVV